ncbi:MAG: hypothetical protein IT385_02880 [Deltaproteobacteria bacterium]|nr:hypothetical protein [Deltaproteobacteria bacterium]
MRPPARLLLTAIPWLGVGVALALVWLQSQAISELGDALEALHRTSSERATRLETAQHRDDELRARLAALEARVEAIAAGARRAEHEVAEARPGARDEGLSQELAALRADVDALREAGPRGGDQGPLQRTLEPIAPITDALGALGGDRGALADVQRLARLQGDRGRLRQLDASVSLSDEERDEVARVLDAWRERQRDVSRRLTGGDLSRAEARAELEVGRGEARVTLERLLGPERFEVARGVLTNLAGSAPRDAVDHRAP